MYFPLSKNNLRQIDKKNEIFLTIKGTGNYQLIMMGNKYIIYEVIINEEKMQKATSIYQLTNPENNVTIRFNYSLTTCNQMFYGIEDLLTVDFSNFDSSQVSDTRGMFYGCKNLKSINFQNFDTSSVKNMEYMFESCNALISLDLSSFDTSKVTSMKNMFKSCISL